MFKHVKKNDSTIPKSGNGIFAKKDISKGTMVGKFSGKKVPISNLSASDCLNSAILDDSTAILGSGLSSCINDIINLRQLTPQETNDILYHNKSFPKREGFEYNAVLVSNKKDIFLKAIRDIRKGNEIFIPYGKRYWLYVFHNKGYLTIFKTDSHGDFTSNKVVE